MKCEFCSGKLCTISSIKDIYRKKEGREVEKGTSENAKACFITKIFVFTFAACYWISQHVTEVSFTTRKQVLLLTLWNTILWIHYKITSRLHTKDFQIFFMTKKKGVKHLYLSYIFAEYLHNSIAWGVNFVFILLILNNNQSRNHCKYCNCNK